MKYHLHMLEAAAVSPIQTVSFSASIEKKILVL